MMITNKKIKQWTTLVLLMLSCMFLEKPGKIFGDNTVFKTSGREESLETAASWLVWPRKLNPVHVVVVFTKFNGEAPGDTLAPSWADELFNGTIGSIPHFFDSISFGQYKVTGEFLPKRYEVPYDADYYVEQYIDTQGSLRRRSYIEYTHDMFKILNRDPDVDFSRYDNEGKDGIPGSADDDGYADYIVLMPRTVPYNFIQQRATGVMTLGLKDPFRSNNKNAVGEYIKIDKNSGCVATAINKNQAIGSICAELSHAYGAVDLMDKVYVDPTNDSAGAGFWDILGRGALGWNERNGPVGPSAYNRMLMDSVGYKNTNLIDIYGVHQNVRMKDVGHPEGKIYRVWISESEYFLIEYRSNIGGNYYDRNIPESGILIWHIDEKESNSTEKNKLCDLECADGKYLDKGYPAGLIPDPIKGSDNLDFWAHDIEYTTKYHGNQGDGTDVFDGVNFTAFGTMTNPNSFSQVTKRTTGIEIFNIRSDGDEMVFDCYLSPFPEKAPTEAPFIGMAFQRSRKSNSYEYLITLEKEIYLINFGLGHRADALVTVGSDSLVIEPLTFLNMYEVQKAIHKKLSTVDLQAASSQLFRRHVSLDTFRTITDDYGVNLEDISGGQELSWVQRIVNVQDHEIVTVTGIELMQNYPNPFNNRTNISYVLSSGGPTSLEVYNILGQRMMVIDRGYEEPGFHSMNLGADDLPSGMYLYRLSGSSLSQTKKFTVIK